MNNSDAQHYLSDMLHFVKKDYSRPLVDALNDTDFALCHSTLYSRLTHVIRALHPERDFYQHVTFSALREFIRCETLATQDAYPEELDELDGLIELKNSIFFFKRLLYYHGMEVIPYARDHAMDLDRHDTLHDYFDSHVDCILSAVRKDLNDLF